MPETPYLLNSIKSDVRLTPCPVDNPATNWSCTGVGLTPYTSPSSSHSIQVALFLCQVSHCHVCTALSLLILLCQPSCVWQVTNVRHPIFHVSSLSFITKLLNLKSVFLSLISSSDLFFLYLLRLILTESTRFVGHFYLYLTQFGFRITSDYFSLILDSCL